MMFLLPIFMLLSLASRAAEVHVFPNEQDALALLSSVCEKMPTLPRANLQSLPCLAEERFESIPHSDIKALYQTKVLPKISTSLSHVSEETVLESLPQYVRFLSTLPTEYLLQVEDHGQNFFLFAEKMATLTIMSMKECLLHLKEQGVSSNFYARFLDLLVDCLTSTPFKARYKKDFFRESVTALLEKCTFDMPTLTNIDTSVRKALNVNIGTKNKKLLCRTFLCSPMIAIISRSYNALDSKDQENRDIITNLYTFYK